MASFVSKISLTVLILGLALDGLAFARDLKKPLQDVRFYGAFDSYGDKKLLEPSAVFYDKSSDELLVADRDANAVLILDNKLSLVHSFGEKSGLSKPLDVVVRGDKIFVSQDEKHFLEIFNFRGVSIGSISPEGVPNFSPSEMDIDENGDIYVLDKANSVCYVIDGTDAIVKTINSDKSISGVTGIAVGRTYVYMFVPFHGPNAIYAFRKDGSRAFGFEGIEGKGGSLNVPVTGKVDSRGRLWVVDAVGGIIVFDMTNIFEPKRIAEFGKLGRNFEVVDFPVNIDFGADGVIYIVEQGRKRISIFK